MKTIVDRKRWFRGPYTLYENSFLLNPSTGMMCCLGFRAKATGLKDEDIAGVAMPANLNCIRSRLQIDSWLLVQEFGRFSSSTDAFQAMEVNDRLHSTDEEREKIITEIFNANGEEIEFVGPRLPIVNGKEVRYEEVESHGGIQ